MLGDATQRYNAQYNTQEHHERADEHNGLRARVSASGHAAKENVHADRNERRPGAKLRGGPSKRRLFAGTRMQGRVCST
jgi:hypothetical protein